MERMAKEITMRERAIIANKFPKEWLKRHSGDANNIWNCLYRPFNILLIIRIFLLRYCCHCFCWSFFPSHFCATVCTSTNIQVYWTCCASQTLGTREEKKLSIIIKIIFDMFMGCCFVTLFLSFLGIQLVLVWLLAWFWF